MTKRMFTAGSIAFVAILFAWSAARAAEMPNMDTMKKAVEKGAQKVMQTAAPSPTTKAAQAFEKVSKELYPKAKQEGNLIIYSVWDVEHLRAITDAFMKRYPGIKATYWQGRNPEIVTRVLTEFQGGQASVDIILSDNAPPVVRAAGAIASYDTVQRDVLLLHDPTMATVSLQIQALTYNTKKLKPADLPKSWEDVANPKFKGMVALDDPMRAGPLSSMLAGLKGQWKDDNRFNNFIKGLKALGVPVHKSTSAMFRLMIAGEYAICMPALLHDVMEEKAKGTPVDYIKTVPPVVFPRQAGIYIKAPNPNAAKLFAEWAISTQGQQTIDSVGRETSRKDFKSKTSIESAYPKGTKPIPVTDKLFLEDPKKWLDANVKPIWEG
ncbi:MAG: extracellular solute-binding protein [Deltaproteobacteria bacterium]|nr:extracellular solute-binding protein [Deltaproteobacteria bacterium]MDZ4343816.1 extracellular solute-binding protein [Candidatus Binatia bacterium]